MNDFSYEGRDLEVLADMPNYYDWIIETFAPYLRGEVVEYGAGCGTISERLVPFANRLSLVEPSANLTHRLRERFGKAANPAVEALGSSLANFAKAAAE